MAGSSFGTLLRVTTWGESHGKAVGAVVDGCPAGIPLTEEDVQRQMDRRRPGTGRFTTQRRETDRAEILSGVFEGKTTGTPISIIIWNENARSGDYEALRDVYRPGHGDMTYDAKYGLRDYRGGGRASGRETAGRTAAGAVALRFLEKEGISVRAYVTAVGPVRLLPEEIRPEEAEENELRLASLSRLPEAQAFLETCMKEGDSAGGIVECRVRGVPAGIGDPVFDKLDARLAQAVMSIGAVKGVEIGDGFAAARRKGSENNDPFLPGEDGIRKASNHSGGTLAGISDGGELILRAAVKPTPSIAAEQKTVTKDGKETLIRIAGRHDPFIAARACSVVEAMTALTVADLILTGRAAR